MKHRRHNFVLDMHVERAYAQKASLYLGEHRMATFSEISVSNTAVGIASAPTRWTKATLTVEDANIRCKWDGTAPTTTQGTKVFQNGSLVLTGGQHIVDFQMIAESGTATVAVMLEN